MARYAIWDKKSDVYTPGGKVFSPEEWIESNSWINNPKAVPVVADGILNGAICAELSEMKKMWENNGYVFDVNMSPEETLAAIEALEDEMNAQVPGPTAEERTAAALEAMADGQTTENAKALNALLGLEE